MISCNHRRRILYLRHHNRNNQKNNDQEDDFNDIDRKFRDNDDLPNDYNEEEKAAGNYDNHNFSFELDPHIMEAVRNVKSVTNDPLLESIYEQVHRLDHNIEKKSVSRNII